MCMKKGVLFISIFAFCLTFSQWAKTQVFDDESTPETFFETRSKSENSSVFKSIGVQNKVQNSDADKIKENADKRSFTSEQTYKQSETKENQDAKKTSVIQQNAVKSNGLQNSESKSSVNSASALPEEMKKPLTNKVKQYKIVDGKRVEEEKEAIYFYYKDFKIVRDTGQLACDVRFVLVTRLAERLTNISMRIVWKKLATRISFSGVEPGVENYRDYRFYGDGCYSLDQLPNVTINRCRLKGRTQKECASLFQLMKWTND